MKKNIWCVVGIQMYSFGNKSHGVFRTEERKMLKLPSGISYYFGPINFLLWKVESLYWKDDFWVCKLGHSTSELPFPQLPLTDCNCPSKYMGNKHF